MPELGFNDMPQAAASDAAPAPLNLAPSTDADVPTSGPAAAAPQSAAPQSTFGSALRSVLPGPNYNPPDPQTSALDQAAGVLDQRIKRAGSVATNPLAQIFAPGTVQAARDFMPKAAEQLQTIKAQQQHAADIKQTARNWNLTNPNQFGEQATDTTLANEALRQWKDEGNFNAYKALSGLSPEWKNRADLYMPDAMSKFGDHVAAVQDGIKTLNGAAAVNSEQAFTAARDKVIRDNDLGSLGIKADSIPKTIDEWMAKRGSLEAQYNGARRTLNALNARQDQLNQATPVTDEKVAKQVEGTYQFGNGEAIPGFKAVSLPGYGDVQGVMGPPGSRDTANRGVTWSNAAPEQIKTVREQLGAEEVKGALSKYKMARDFNLTAQNKDLYKAAAGIALNADELGAIGRDVAEGSKAAGSIGLTKMLESKYGYIDVARNAINREISALQAWRGKPASERLAPPSIAGIQLVAQFKHDVALKEVQDRAGQPLETAGRYGMLLKNLGLDKELIDDPTLRGTYDNALRQGNRELDSYPMVTIGDRRVLLPTGSNVPGAKVAPLDHGAPPAQPNQQPNAVTPPPGQAGVGVQQPAPPSQQQPLPGGAGSPPTAPQPVRVAGLDVNVPLPPGASPSFVQAAQRVESGNERNPWTATAKGSTASGAFQFIDSTWKENRPAGAPERAKDATPEQQAQAFATLTAKNTASLQANRIPVNDTSLYVMHNLGAGGGATLLQADPSADARSVVGEAAARNNPQFFKGRPTVAVALQRYADAMGAPPSGGVSGVANAAPAPGLKDMAIGAAPAIGSTIGAIGGGALGNVPGAVAGGAAGGAAGQALKDYLQGSEQSPVKIAEQAALGGVLGVSGLPRGLNMLARAGGSGAIEAGAEAAKGGENADPLAAGAKGAAEGLGGEAFGRALGMVGHKVYSLFAPDAREAVRAAAKTYADATEVLRTEAPKLPGVGGAAGTVNPKYAAAETAQTKAEMTLKDAGMKPEEAAYAHKVSSEGVPKQEAQAAKPGALEQQRVGTGYQQIESEVSSKGVGAPKSTPPMPDGPVAKATEQKMSPGMLRTAERTEMAISLPAANWQAKWVQLKDARSALLELERDAITSTSAGRTQQAKDYRALAGTVRKQQEKAADAVFGPVEGPKVIDRLKVLDTRYRNLMEATNGGDLAKAAGTAGEAGRDADRKFRAFAHDDPVALAAWAAMRKRGPNLEKDVKNLVAVEKLGILGRMYSGAKALLSLNSWMRERAAGNPAKFSDFINAGDGGAHATRDVAGSIGARGAAQTDLPNQAGAALNAALP